MAIRTNFKPFPNGFNFSTSGTEYAGEFMTIKALGRGDMDAIRHILKYEPPKDSEELCLKYSKLREYAVQCIPSDDEGIAISTTLSHILQSKNLDTIKLLMNEVAQRKIELKFELLSLRDLCWIEDLQMLEDLAPLLKDVNKQDQYLKTILFYALQANHINLIKTLLKNGANLDIVLSTKGYTFLHFVCQKSDVHLEIIQILCEHGANFDVECENGSTAFFQALAKARHEVALYLLTHSKNSLTPRFENGPSALHYAATNMHVDIVDALIDLGLDVNLKAYENKQHYLLNVPNMYTPLYRAHKSRQIEVYEYMIYRGANYNTADDNYRAVFRTIVADWEMLRPVNQPFDFQTEDLLDLRNTYHAYYRTCRVEMIKMGHEMIIPGLTLFQIISSTPEEFLEYYDKYENGDLIDLVEKYDSDYPFFIPYFKNTVLRGVQKIFRKRRAVKVITHLLELKLNIASYHIAEVIVNHMTPFDLIYFNDAKCMDILGPPNKIEEDKMNVKTLAQYIENMAQQKTILPDIFKIFNQN